MPRATALIELRVTPKKDTGFDEIAGTGDGLPRGGERLPHVRRLRSWPSPSRAKTMSDIAMFVAKRLAPIDGVLSTATHFMLTKYKDGGVDVCHRLR